MSIFLGPGNQQTGGSSTITLEQAPAPHPGQTTALVFPVAPPTASQSAVPELLNIQTLIDQLIEENRELYWLKTATYDDIIKFLNSRGRPRDPRVFLKLKRIAELMNPTEQDILKALVQLGFDEVKAQELELSDGYDFDPSKVAFDEVSYELLDKLQQLKIRPTLDRVKEYEKKTAKERLENEAKAKCVRDEQRLAELHQQKEALERECEDHRQAMRAASEQISSLEKKLSELDKELENARTSHSEQLGAMQQARERERASLQQQLASAQSAYARYRRSDP